MKKSLARFIISCVEDLCLKEISKSEKDKTVEDLYKKADIDENTQLDRRQLNELILLCKETRVTEEFFGYFAVGANKLLIKNLPALIDRFKKHSMLKYGNFKFALKKLIKSTNIENDLGSWVECPQKLEEDFSKRPKPILELQKIERDKVHFLGYLSNGKTKNIVEKGKYNTQVYLTSDYMDVYVATSMREQKDFQNVYDLCEAVFSNPKIKRLNLRYFDPTQSFHENRIAKGLIEGLMLKRAKCTIYAAQESDSLGKDSELAATLAQGKPVIAFIPKFDIDDKKQLKSLSDLPLNKLLDLAYLYYEKVPKRLRVVFELFFERIQNYLIPAEKLFSRGIKDIAEDESKFKNKMNVSGRKFMDFIEIIAKAQAAFYDNRDSVLRKYHPLSLQINLESGVANGVLIARTYDQCADLLYDVLTNQLDFVLIKPGEKKSGYPKDQINYLLCERKSKCAFRVVTTDGLLTNSFWNFYLEEGSEKKHSRN